MEKRVYRCTTSEREGATSLTFALGVYLTTNLTIAFNIEVYTIKWEQNI